MIDRQHGMVIFECDVCDETLDTEEDDFELALAQFRREGWKSERVGGDWVHTCPACRRDDVRRAFRHG